MEFENVDAETTRGFYVRAHWLVIAAHEKSIAENEAILRESTAPGEEWMRETIRASLPMVRTRIRDYQAQYEVTLRDNNLAIMRRFLDNVRGAYCAEPEFAFLAKK